MKKRIDVAAAVLQREDGSFMLAQRPNDKIWAGYWEFPGGKIEPGETPQDALIRELNEELGIDASTLYPWICRTFEYPHAIVTLHFFRITAWQGTPYPHEGQSLFWQAGNQPLAVDPMLPANAPVLRALQLPPVYGISHVAELGESEFLRRMELALNQGLKLVQLREKQLDPGQTYQLAQKMLPLLRQHGAKLIINGDVALARSIGADGVQLNATQLTNLQTRPDVEWCGASCHNLDELKRAEILGCDFALLSPVMPTRSHPDAPALGWDAFAAIAAKTAIPVYALGGMTQGDLRHAWVHGAHGVALLRQAWPTGSPA